MFDNATIRRALPGQLFSSTRIPVCLWFLAKKNADAKRGFRDRRQQTLFIDARKLGTLIDRVHRELTYAYLEKITPRRNCRKKFHARRKVNNYKTRAASFCPLNQAGYFTVPPP